MEHDGASFWQNGHAKTKCVSVFLLALSCVDEMLAVLESN